MGVPQLGTAPGGRSTYPTSQIVAVDLARPLGVLPYALRCEENLLPGRDVAVFPYHYPVGVLLPELRYSLG